MRTRICPFCDYPKAKKRRRVEKYVFNNNKYYILQEYYYCGKCFAKFQTGGQLDETIKRIRWKLNAEDLEAYKRELGIK